MNSTTGKRKTVPLNKGLRLAENHEELQITTKVNFHIFHPHSSFQLFTFLEYSLQKLRFPNKL